MSFSPNFFTKPIDSYYNELERHVHRIPKAVHSAFVDACEVFWNVPTTTHDQEHSTAPISSPTNHARAQQCLDEFDRTLEAVRLTIDFRDFLDVTRGGVRLAFKIGLNHQPYFDSIASSIELLSDHLFFLGRYTLNIFLSSAEIQNCFLHVYKHLWIICEEIRYVFVGDFNNEKFVHPTIRGGSLWQEVDKKAAHARKVLDSDTYNIINLIRRDLSTSDMLALERDNQHRAERRKRNDDEAERNRLERRRDVILWMSGLDYTHTQDDVLRCRFADTGNWLLGREEFKNWLMGDDTGILWCWGNPGVGKTVLSSIVQDHISRTFSHALDVGNAFVYCTYREPLKPESYIRSYMRQLLAQLSVLPTGVEVNNIPFRAVFIRL